MELKFTGIVECIDPIIWSWQDNNYPRLPIKVKWIGIFDRNCWMFMIHWWNIDKYPIKQWDLVDIYYKMNCSRYSDTGKIHWSNNVINIVQVDDYDNYF